MDDALRRSLPEVGLAPQDIINELKENRSADGDWHSGRTWSLVYHESDDHSAFLKQVYTEYFNENALNPTVFPSLKKMESEVVRMTTDLLHGGPDACGVMTSGGTESILCAMLAYRERGKKKGIKNPNIVLPKTAHVAFHKAAKYFQLETRLMDIDDEFRAKVSELDRLVDNNTIAIIGSAPNYPSGVIDPISNIGAWIGKRDIPLHVDACVGGFMLSFLPQLGFATPEFAFSIPQVSSISLDIHKYAFGAKGASVLAFKNMDYLEHLFFVYTEWSGGVYGSSTLLGTRPGGAIAAAWGTLLKHGKDGYLDLFRRIMLATERMQKGIASIEGLSILGKPDMSVFGYNSTEKKLNIFAIADQMQKRGWFIDRQQNPDCMHAMVTPNHDSIIEEFLIDLSECTQAVRSNPELAFNGTAATYGLISDLPMRKMVHNDVVKYMKQMYAPHPVMPDLEGKNRPVAQRLQHAIGKGFLRLKNLI